MSQVTIYTTPTCSYCNAAKAFFQQNSVSYQEKDVTTDINAQQEMIAKSGQMGVPVIDVAGSVVIGFDQPRLKELLKLN